MFPILLFLFVGFADIVATSLLMHAGIIEEWNPLLLWFLHGGGLPIMILFKISHHMLFVGITALPIERKWIERKRARRYIFAGTVLYSLLIVPAYVLLFLH